MKSAFKLLLTILCLSFFACEDELVEPVVANAEDVIEVNSELYGLLERVAVSADDNSEIACIDFNYPFTVYTYDADLLFLEDFLVSSDAEFSTLLGDLDQSYSISVSLPIASTLSNGLAINITTNEELKEAIDNCLEEEFLVYCNQTLPNCIWEVSYLEAGENIYEDSFFDVNADGTVVFNFNDNTYNGTWITLMIEDEAHLNINLDNNADVAADWNFDWLIELTDNGHFKIDNGQTMYILEQNCEETCDLTFEACETDTGSGIAQFDLSSHVPCILSIADVNDPTTVIVSFHTTQVDAEANLNAILDVFTNTLNPQILFVRIEDNATSEASYLSINLQATTCQ